MVDLFFLQQKALLLGQATLTRTMKVAEVQDGVLVPPRQRPEDFILHPENLDKHQVALEDFGSLKNYKVVYAWR